MFVSFRSWRRGADDMTIDIIKIELTPDLVTSDWDLCHVAWQTLQKIAGMATGTAMYEMILIEHFVS
jgi:hypothetical protein